MPSRGSRLSREKEAIHADCLRQLQGEGVDVEIPEEWQGNSRAFDIELAPPPESIVFETPSGGIRYASRVRVLALQSGVTLIDWDISTRWDDQIVAESFDGQSEICKLGQQEYRQCEVLNHRIERGLPLRRGQIVEGWILANGLEPIPAEYRDCSIAPFEVRFLDQFRCEHLAAGKLSVLRTAKRDSRNPRPGTRLYGLDPDGHVKGTVRE